jgi:ADP-heptose:LPS heptosyltransferase
MGDTVCSLPAAAALKRAFPDCHITWVVDRRFAGIVECCAAVDAILPIKFSLGAIPTYEQEFDAALDLQGLSKSALCIWRAKARVKVGYHWRREGAWLFSQRVIPDPTSLHVVDQYVDVARSVGGIMERAEFCLAPKPEDTAAIKMLLTEHKVGDRFVVVNAGAGWATKRWVPASFAKVADDLASRGICTVLTGGKKQEDLDAANEVISQCQSKPVSMLGATTVRSLVALIELADAHVGGDTGTTHIAAALGKPAIGLYSITKPERTCPYGQISRCLYDPQSLANIHPDAVNSLLREVLP